MLPHDESQWAAAPVQLVLEQAAHDKLLVSHTQCWFFKGLEGLEIEGGNTSKNFADRNLEEINEVDSSPQ